MVSFRFHLVSVIAVFLALALGITMGATVIDHATVELLRGQIRTATQQRTDSDKAKSDAIAQKNAVQDQLNKAVGFEQGAAPLLVSGRLSNVPVLLISVRGADQNLKDVRDLLTAAGASVEGTIWFTKGLRLDKTDATTADLAARLGTGLQDADSVRRFALDAAARWLTAGPAGKAQVAMVSPLTVLQEKGMIDFDKGSVDNVGKLPVAGTRFVVVSSATPDVPNEQVAIPFVDNLVQLAPNLVLAAEPGLGPDPTQLVREQFVGPLRTDTTVRNKLYTGDNIEDVRGRLALVYALAELSPQQSGHYGVGPHASDGPLPHP
jgi:hypothetical protein